MFEKNGIKLESLNYVFCTDEELLAINNQFLSHDFYTDIITFDLSETKGMKIGEIYISIDRVRENASIHNTSFKLELHRVIFHGVLHLCGYKDKSKEQKRLMRKMEALHLNTYFAEH